MMTEKVMIMIPTYNERENIVCLIEEILEILPRAEIVVVDDNSPDGTADLVRKMESVHSGVHLLLRQGRRGRGLAGIDGFRYALQQGADYIIEMDADFSHHPTYLPAFLEAIKECDVVLGSRFVDGGESIDRGLIREAITRFAVSYIKWILKVNIADGTSGYRCFRRKVLESINLNELVSHGPPIVQEILYKCCLQGFNIKEIPIVFKDRHRGKSSLHPLILLDAFLMILRLKWGKKGEEVSGSK
ncbi:MAG: polyprenol monophosphomannose synthase [bacterium]|nr:polyprenol monophosphomannose synthase [bacterium]